MLDGLQDRPSRAFLASWASGSTGMKLHKGAKVRIMHDIVDDDYHKGRSTVAREGDIGEVCYEYELGWPKTIKVNDMSLWLDRHDFELLPDPPLTQLAKALDEDDK